MNRNRFSFLVVGLALFSMFFGSGNLIFPLFLGQISQEHWLVAFGGFVTTAVAMPLLAVLCMVLYRGNYGEFFNTLGKTPGILLALIILTVWIPLGSAPRCAALAHASLLPYLENSFLQGALPLWGFSLLYCSVVFWMVVRKHQILDLLGYILTPLLLLCLGLIIFQGVSFSSLSFSCSAPFSFFSRGLKEGYNTMDLIAAFFFSASVIDLLRRSSSDESLSLSITLKGSLFAAFLLACVYLGLVSLAASHQEALQGIPKEQLFVQSAKLVLGHQLGIIAALAVILACLTTSIALSSVFTDFLFKNIFQENIKHRTALIATQLMTFAISITGLEGITFITGPVLEILYPLLLLLIVGNLARKIFAKERSAIADIAE